MTEEEYREQLQNVMMRAMMEPDEAKRQEITRQINTLEKRHMQAQFSGNSNAALDEMFAETDVNITNEITGGKIK